MRSKLRRACSCMYRVWATLVQDCDRQTTVLCGRHKLKEGLAQVANSNFLKSSRASPVAHLLLRSTNFSCDLESAIDAFLIRLRHAKCQDKPEALNPISARTSLIEPWRKMTLGLRLGKNHKAAAIKTLSQRNDARSGPCMECWRGWRRLRAEKSGVHQNRQLAFRAQMPR